MTEVEELLSAGERILENPHCTSPMWLRAASLVLRAALEESLDAYWMAKSPGIATTNRSCQLACLASWKGEAVARDVSNAWGQLSTMAHHRTDLGPDRLAVVRAADEVRRLVVELTMASR